MMNKYNKIFVITRSDLEIGQQAVQASHALTEFIFEHTEIAKQWKNYSNTLVMLSTDNENKLRSLIENLISKNVMFSVFREPDLQNQITAIALEPGKISQKICNRIPLALSNR